MVPLCGIITLQRTDGILQCGAWGVEKLSLGRYMDKKEFSEIRRRLGKTQKQMAQLLGTSPKTIQGFDQGWRNIPVHTERQMLGQTLLDHKMFMMR